MFFVHYMEFHVHSFTMDSISIFNHKINRLATHALFYHTFMNQSHVLPFELRPFSYFDNGAKLRKNLYLK